MSGRRIVVTGAFGVLGAAVAKAVAADGGRLALLDFAPAPPDGLVAACGPGGAGSTRGSAQVGHMARPGTEAGR